MKLSLIGYGRMDFNTPLSAGALDRVLAHAGLKAGERALELGAGNAALAAHLAQAHGLTVEAVERNAAMIERARERTAAGCPPGEVRLRHTTSAAFLKEAGEFDLVSAVGAVGLVEGDQHPRAVLGALRRHVRPGGCLLWGETYWRTPPGAQLKALTDPIGVYGSYGDYVEAVAAAGFQPLYVHTSSQAEWDDYFWSFNAAVEDWLDENRDDPDWSTIRQRLDAWRGLFVTEAREAMNFALFLLRRPAGTE